MTDELIERCARAACLAEGMDPEHQSNDEFDEGARLWTTYVPMVRAVLIMAKVLPCERCNSTEWVCENHPDRPWADQPGSGPNACGCGAGKPCPECNPLSKERRG